ncbi:hypothetical protein HUE58_01925 [Candidatus Ruthia endofausta]|uniref:Uncharacterized protein n=1 Tax=Candidatus Ruthia endofausta TaxID=2738852 RepID=A0A6N0HNJ8_9GAMM|nr:hypothetical protein [Candidatus Ruthia endofausta]QKQ23949.1 hypothetical protein HUE58_01925 [Candidatus Ruthia endofausta]
MNRIDKGYNDKEFELMGEFFIEQEMHSIGKQNYDNTKTKVGKKLHKKYCLVVIQKVAQSLMMRLDY